MVTLPLTSARVTRRSVFGYSLGELTGVPGGDVHKDMETHMTVAPKIYFITTLVYTHSPAIP